MKKDENELNFLDQYKEIAISIALIVVGFYLVVNILPDFKIEANENWGPIGDFIGGLLNPIFSLIALFALLATIKIQVKELDYTNKQLKNSHEELNLTREEVSLARKATEDSSKALIEQSNSIKIQNFENTFFKMLDLHNQIVDNFSIGEPVYKRGSSLIVESTNIINKREAINHICVKFDNHIKRSIDNPYFKGSFKKIYNYLHQTDQELIGHYFGTIYQILKLISLSNILKDDEKNKYAHIFRAQFSANELKLLYYHCIGEIGEKRLKGYIEKFEFFEHLPLSIVKDNNKYILKSKPFHIKAFGENEEWKEEINKFNKIN